MRPIKNRIFCPQSNKTKMLFDSKEESIRFLKFNATDIATETGKKPVRVYYCHACGGWHVTSKPQSSDKKALMKRFGSDEGSRIFEEVKDIKGKDASIKKGLQRKIKQLRHVLKFTRVDMDRCERLINELIGNFETVIRVQLEERGVIESLFMKFSELCNLFIYQKQLQRPTI